MSGEIKTTPFNFNKTESEIAARWEVGVRDYARPIAITFTGAICLIEAYKLTNGIKDIKSFMMEVVVLFIFLFVIKKLTEKTQQTANAIAARSLELLCDGENLTLYEGGSQIFKTAVCEITRVDGGPNVLRIACPAGAICLPRRVLGDELVAALRERLGKENFKVHGWM